MDSHEKVKQLVQKHQTTHSNNNERMKPPVAISVGNVFLSLLMIAIGSFLFFQNVQVHSSFNLGFSLVSMGGYNLTSGIILLVFMAGVALIFYNPKSDLGWWITILGLLILFLSVLMSLRFSFAAMSSFELILILTFLAGGVGLFFRELFKFG